MHSTFVFGYGSLVHHQALERFLGRTLGPDDFAIARLRGYRRARNEARDNRIASHATVWVGADDRPHDGTVTVLGIEPVDDSVTNGIVVRVDERSLELLDRREIAYDRIDVTEFVDVEGVDYETIFTYVPDEEHRGLHDSGHAAALDAIADEYVNLVTAAFESLNMIDEYHETTRPPESPVLSLRRAVSREVSGY